MYLQKWVQKSTKVGSTDQNPPEEVHSDIQMLFPGHTREGCDSPNVAKKDETRWPLETLNQLLTSYSQRRCETHESDKTLQRLYFELYLRKTLPCIQGVNCETELFSNNCQRLLTVVVTETGWPTNLYVSMQISNKTH